MNSKIFSFGAIAIGIGVGVATKSWAVGIAVCIALAFLPYGKQKFFKKKPNDN